MRPSASPPTILGEGGRGKGREEGSGWLGRKSGSVRRKKAIHRRRREQQEEQDHIGGGVVVGVVDGWMFGCENAIARFSSSSRRHGRQAVDFLAQVSSQL